MLRSPRLLALILAMLVPLAVALALGAQRLLAGRERAHDYVVRIELPPPGSEIGLPRVEGPLDPTRPLVVIDAGHGGHDPGAQSGGRDEKRLTLALARALRDRLLALGGIRVALTRDSDTFLALEERSGIARRLKADLFVSIHADSVNSKGEPNGGDTPGARGATVYTLSDRGSSQEASRLADKENRADMINGVDRASTSDDVSAILVDLSQRRSAEQSAELARLILREGAGHLMFRENPLQSAAFVVLKSPDLPSALVEAGYISNRDDAARLASPAGRAAFADVLAQAIRVYFARAAIPGAGVAAPVAPGAASPRARR